MQRKGDLASPRKDWVGEEGGEDGVGGEGGRRGKQEEGHGGSTLGGFSLPRLFFLCRYLIYPHDALLSCVDMRLQEVKQPHGGHRILKHPGCTPFLFLSLSPTLNIFEQNQPGKWGRLRAVNTFFWFSGLLRL